MAATSNSFDAAVVLIRSGADINARGEVSTSLIQMHDVKIYALTLIPLNE